MEFRMEGKALRTLPVTAPPLAAHQPCWPPGDARPSAPGLCIGSSRLPVLPPLRWLSCLQGATPDPTLDVLEALPFFLTLFHRHHHVWGFTAVPHRTSASQEEGPARMTIQCSAQGRAGHTAGTQ